MQASTSRKRSLPWTDDQDIVSPRRVHFKSDSEESSHSVQQYDTEVAIDSDDHSDSSMTEYEVTHLESKRNPAISTDESDELDEIAELGAVAAKISASLSDIDLGQLADSSTSPSTSPSSNSDADPELPRLDLLDYWTCIKCKNGVKNRHVPFCDECYSYRKTFYNERARRRRAILRASSYPQAKLATEGVARFASESSLGATIDVVDGPVGRSQCISRDSSTASYLSSSENNALQALESNPSKHASSITINIENLSSSAAESVDEVDCPSKRVKKSSFLESFPASRTSSSGTTPKSHGSAIDSINKQSRGSAPGDTNAIHRNVSTENNSVSRSSSYASTVPVESQLSQSSSFRSTPNTSVSETDQMSRTSSKANTPITSTSDIVQSSRSGSNSFKSTPNTSTSEKIHSRGCSTSTPGDNIESNPLSQASLFRSTPNNENGCTPDNEHNSRSSSSCTPGTSTTGRASRGSSSASTPGTSITYVIGENPKEIITKEESTPSETRGPFPVCQLCASRPANAGFAHRNTIHTDFACYYCARRTWRDSAHCPLCRLKIAGVYRII